MEPCPQKQAGPSGRNIVAAIMLAGLPLILKQEYYDSEKISFAPCDFFCPFCLPLLFLPSPFWRARLFMWPMETPSPSSPPTVAGTGSRLYGIDAPERKMPFGRKSGEALARLVAGENIARGAHVHGRLRQDCRPG